MAVPFDQEGQPVRCFSTFTQDLHRLADWLLVCGIETVAMESTRVYWIPLFQILEARGLDVCRVDARSGTFLIANGCSIYTPWVCYGALSTHAGSLHFKDVAAP